MRFDDLKKSLSSTDRAVLDRFLKEEESQIEKTVQNEITTDKEHVDIVNRVAYAFTESGPAKETGFHFIRVEPFYSEEGSPRFDLVIHNPKLKITVLVECKSSVSSPRESLDRMKIAGSYARENQAELEHEIGDSVQWLEFAICAPAHTAKSVLEEVQKSDRTIIVWSLDVFDDTLQLLKPSENIPDDIAKGRMHRSDALRKKLFDGVESPGSFIHFLPSSHMCRLLQTTINSLQNDVFLGRSGSERTFTLADVHGVLRRELLNFETGEVERLSKRIVESGIDYKIFTVEDPQGSQDPADWMLKVPFETRGPKGVEKTVRNLYVNAKQAAQAKDRAVKHFDEYVNSNPNRLRFE